LRGIFPTLLAFGVGLFVLILIWRLLTKGAKVRLASLGDGEIDRTASEFIEKHGDEADGAIAKLAEECLAIGDFEGEAVWQRVAKAVAKLQSK
jgi:hypothetical protein